MSKAGAFSLGREGAADDGSFKRQDSRFRDWVAEPEAGRYHLYVSWACPWAHRTVIGRRLKGLEDVISLDVVDPHRDDAGWVFTGGEFVDHVNGFERLGQAYEQTEPDFAGRYSVPVLWDKVEGRIVNNESADILRMLDTVFQPLATTDAVLVPETLRDEIDELNGRLYDTVNNAVYKAGFARRQAVYEREVVGIFDTLDELDERLGERRFLFGDAPVETDWRLFTTLVRFDAVYAIHFKCSLQRITEYEHLWPYLRDLYQWPGIAETVRFDQIRAHYYGTHPQINPSGIMALQPRGDFEAPHGRERLGVS
jgi:glutathionyl-hydroquinone reductase